MQKDVNQNERGGIFGASSGDMGKRISVYDWTKSALGATDGWPQSLRSALSICLNSNFPIAIYWGPELVLLYNDAWSPIPGNKHPWALGKPAREVWPDIWNDIEPQFEKAFAGTPGGSRDALLPMQRHGYTEECYFDFTFTPVYGESGQVEGVFNAVIETTYRVIAERRASVLQRLSDRLNGNRSSIEVYANAKSVLDAAKFDVPFYCIFELDENGKADVKVTSDGVSVSDVSLAGDLASDNNVRINDLTKYFKNVPGGHWPEPSHEGIIVPLRSNENKVSGGVIAGLSSRRGFDKDYEGFYESVGIIVSGEVNTIRSLEEERKRAEALQALDKAKTMFFSNISHEFRTPLTLMLGPLEELLQNTTRPAEEQDNLEATHRNAMRLLRLVNTLLDFSRLESGRVKARYAPSKLDTLTVDLASSFRSAIENGGLEYNVTVNEIAEAVYVDREMWEKIVLNLISNAFKYTLTGSINVSLQAQHGKAVLKVHDTGIGIPENELPKMFERFHRVENAQGRTHEGTGIGLSLVNELVKLHGGTITIESTVGKGSTFTVEIPSGKGHLPQEQVVDRSVEETDSILSDIYLQEAVSLTSVHDEDRDMSGLEASTPEPTYRNKVLVVDDNADMRAYIIRLLQDSYEVQSAANGMEAFQTLLSFKADIVLSDIMMPVMDGIQLLTKLKEDKSLRNIPVVLLSARAGEEARIEGYNIGADDYLIKPFSAKELLARVKAQLNIAKIRRKIEASESKFRNLVTQAPVGIAILTGPDFIVEVANDSYLQLVNRTREAFVGKPLRNGLPEIEATAVLGLLSRVVATSEPFYGNEFPLVLRRNGRDEQCYFNFVYQPLIEDDVTTGVVVVVVEVTEVINARTKAQHLATELEEKVVERTTELQLTNTRLENSNHDLEQFAYVASHDLQEPLRKIQTFSELLSQNLTSPEKAQRYLNKIDSSASRMTALIRDVLNYSRLSKGKEQFTSVDLNSVLNNVEHDFELLIEEKGATVKHGALPVITGISLQIHQLFSNLIGNSLKFSDKAPLIEVSGRRMSKDEVAKNKALKASEDYIELKFQDNGIGFEQQYADRIFVIFQRLNYNNEHAGTGIGLALCKKIVENHRGQIEAKSELGSGATFYIRLPLS